jgi:hypothetical protein
MRQKYWEIIADNLSKAGWTWGCVSTVVHRGRTIWIADGHRATQINAEALAGLSLVGTFLSRRRLGLVRRDLGDGVVATVCHPDTSTVEKNASGCVSDGVELGGVATP